MPGIGTKFMAFIECNESQLFRKPPPEKKKQLKSTYRPAATATIGARTPCTAGAGYFRAFSLN